jgi:hypothetical protein
MRKESSHSRRICKEPKCPEPTVYLVESRANFSRDILWPIDPEGSFPNILDSGGLCRTHGEAKIAAGSAQIVKTGCLSERDFNEILQKIE